MFVLDYFSPLLWENGTTNTMYVAEVIEHLNTSLETSSKIQNWTDNDLTLAKVKTYNVQYASKKTSHVRSVC